MILPSSLAGICSLVLTLAAVSASGAGDPDEVLALLATRKHGHVEFIEQKFIAALDRPIESSGELRFDAPDHLEQRTLKPRPESLVLDNGTLTDRKSVV